MEDIPKLCTAFAEWMSCVMIVLLYKKNICRNNWKKMCILFFAGAIGLAVIQTICGKVTGIFWLMGMVGAVLLMIILIRFGIETTWRTGAYLCARGFLLAEFIAALEWQLYSFYFDNRGKNYILEIFFCILFFAVGYGFFYYVTYKNQEKRKNFCLPEVNEREFILVWLLTVFIFAFSNLSYVQITSPFSEMDTYGIFNVRTLTDLAGFFILELLYTQKADWDKMKEMGEIQNILQMQYVQYRESQENIDLLNRKYHDLKHQIQIVRRESCEEKKNAYLQEIESGLMRYEAEIKTGNSVLDTIFTSKSKICQKNHIMLSVMADGTLVRYFHVMDLCTIFGNALDNAIEYEMQLENLEKRRIHVKVAKKETFICIVVENYYEGSWQSGKDWPQTTKADRRYHGYGLKSMQYSVNKYGGYLNLKVKDNWFRVEILIPDK